MRFEIRQRARPKVRIALDSHDTMGLGHLRRNQLIARVLAEAPVEAEILMIAGVHEGAAFSMPPCVDRLTLPAYRKDQGGSYAPRSLRQETAALTALRAWVIDSAMRSSHCSGARVSATTPRMASASPSHWAGSPSWRCGCNASSPARR